MKVKMVNLLASDAPIVHAERKTLRVRRINHSFCNFLDNQNQVLKDSRRCLKEGLIVSPRNHQRMSLIYWLKT